MYTRVRPSASEDTSQEHQSTPVVHQDQALWEAVKARWPEVEKMLAERQERLSALSTLSRTPRHTVKKTYVIDERHIALIAKYADAFGWELQDVVYAAFEQFFARAGYLDATSS